MRIKRGGYWVLFWMFVLVFAVTAVGCDAKNEENKAAVSQNAVSEKQTPEKPVYDFPDEVYGDPEIWSAPRIQFVWQHPDDEYVSIWSMKTDGTDVRRAAGPDLLSIDAGERYDLNTLPVRSPDNRYLAVVVTNFGKYNLAQYMIIDLKNKSKKAFMLDAAPPNFNWTRDNRYLYFYDRRRFLKYDATTQSFEVVPKIYAKALYLIDNDSAFLGLQSRSLEFYDRQGRLVRKVGLPVSEDIDSNLHELSPDKKVLKISIRGRRFYFLNVLDPNNVIFKSDPNVHRMGETTFLPGSNKLIGFISRKKYELAVFDLGTHTINFLYDAELKNGQIFLSLINYHTD